MIKKFIEIIKSKFPGKISVTVNIILLTIFLVLVSLMNAAPSDGEIPVISITYPTDGQNFSIASITVSGTASDNVSVVEVRVGAAGGYTTVSGTESWNAPVTLESGSNTIYARATDTSGNTSETSVNVTYSLPDNTYKDTSSDGGGGGGGGGGTSGENFTNIILKEKHDMYIYKNTVTSYAFTNANNPVLFVNISGNINAGEINTAVEVLKNTSTLVKKSAPGIVYKNVNIWVGTSGFAASNNIKEAFIKFKVDNDWMSANSVTSSDIILKKWNGNSWIDLETRVLSKDDANTFFEGKTYTFSPFAIVAKTVEMKPTDKVQASEIQQPDVKAPSHNEKSSQPAETAIVTRIASSEISTWSTILMVLIIDIILVAMYFFWLKK